jgi:hypothetical protein
MTDVQLVDERNKVFGAILSDPDDENSINAYDAINTVLADRYEAMVATQRIIDKF